MSPLRRRNQQGVATSSGSQLTRFRNEIDRLVDRFFQSPWGSGVSDVFDMLPGPSAWTPAIDVNENDDRIVLRAELPGMEAKDIKVSVAGNRLTISGEKSEETEQKEKGSYYCERCFGAFRRTLDLPDNIDASNISAEYGNGVLTVTAPRLASAKARHVEVKPTAPEISQPQRVPVGASR